MGEVAGLQGNKPVSEKDLKNILVD